jgi:hypothetical protein
MRVLITLRRIVIVFVIMLIFASVERLEICSAAIDTVLFISSGAVVRH